MIRRHSTHLSTAQTSCSTKSPEHRSDPGNRRHVRDLHLLLDLVSCLSLPHSMAPPSASTQVFNIPELAENIILQLELWYLLVMDNVSNFHRELIANSPKLQRRMTLDSADYSKRSHISEYFLRLSPCGSPCCPLLPSLDDVGARKLYYLVKMENLDGAHLSDLTLSKCLTVKGLVTGSSWRKLRVSPLRVQLSIGVQPVDEYGTIRRCHFSFEAGQCTLGDVADCMEAVLATDPEIMEFRKQAIAATGRP